MIKVSKREDGYKVRIAPRSHRNNRLTDLGLVVKVDCDYKVTEVVYSRGPWRCKGKLAGWRYEIQIDDNSELELFRLEPDKPKEPDAPKVKTKRRSLAKKKKPCGCGKKRK